MFYGWYVVAACNAVAVVAWGIGVFTQGVFVGYYANNNDWSTTALSAGATVFHLSAGIAGIGVGRTLDRRGPRPVLLAGAATLAIGTAVLGSVGELWQIYLAFAVLGMGFAGLHTVTLGKIIASWFERLRGRAMTIATLGASAGGMILVPLTARSLEERGPTITGLALGATALLLVVPVTLTVIKDPSKSAGFQPDGGPATPNSETTSAPEPADTWPLRELTDHPVFWILVTSLPVAMMAQSALLFHHVVFLTSTSFTLVEAASVVTVTTGLAIVGRLAFAVVGDRWPPPTTASVVFAGQAVAFAVLALSTSGAGLIVGSALFGLTMGIVILVQPLTVAFTFGSASFGQAYGPIYFAIRAGAAIGPLLVGIGTAVFGSYRLTWGITSVALVIAAAAIRRANQPIEAGSR